MITWRVRFYELRDTAAPALTGPNGQVRNTPEPCSSRRIDRFGDGAHKFGHE